VPPAASHAFDCVGATAAGMRAALVNRRQPLLAAVPHASDLAVAALTEPAESWRCEAIDRRRRFC